MNRADRRRARRAEAVARVQAAHDTGERYYSGDPTWRKAVHGSVSNSEPFSGHATVYRCVRVLTNALISAPLIEIEGPRRSPKVVEDGAWAPMLDDPNPHQTQRQLVEAFGTYLLLDGEVGLYCEGASGPAQPGEIPREVWPLPKTALEPLVDEQSKILLGWKVQTGAGQIDVPAHSLIHLRFFNPTDPLRGLSPLSAAATGLRSDQKAEAWGEAFFDNGAEPGGVLSTEGALSPKQRREMRESWEEKHRGSTKAHRVAVLEGGLTYQAIGIPQKDMQFLEQRGWNETQIAKVFGVPKFFLMDSTDISYASTRQNKLALWELGVLPIVSMIEDVLRVRLCGPRTGRQDRIAFDLTQVDALREMIDGTVGTAEGLVRLGYPLNEVNERLELGMRAQSWGDEGTLPMGVAPAADVATGAADDFDDADDLDDDADAETDPLPQEDKPDDVEPVRSARVTAERERRVALWNEIERTVNRPGSAKMEKRLRGFTRGRRAEVVRFLHSLTRAGDGGYAKKVRAFLEAAEKRWSDQIAKQVRPVYRSVIADAIAGLARELGGLSVFKAAHPSVARFIAEKEVLVRSIPKSMIRSLRIAMLESSAAGEGVGDLQIRVDRALKSSKQVFRATMARTSAIARSETSAVTNGTRRLAMEAEGVERVEWLTSHDEAVRDETASPRKRPKANHRKLDGEIRKVGETFVKGITLRNPGDTAAPAQWAVNCRCGLAPVRTK